MFASMTAFALISAQPGALAQNNQPSQAGISGGDGLSLSTTDETLFRADEVIHHSDLGVTVLRGDVEIAQAGRVLTADTVSYNRASNTLTASGNVVMMQPDGTVAFSTYIEITSDGFKNGVIENIRLLLTDDARVAANGARRSDGNRTEMSKAVYSPCEVCREDPDQSPLWQLKARRITHDDQERLLQYEDVWLEVGGVPVLYSPYFQHYDPRVERKSGLLVPTFGSTGGLGQFVQPRYFWAYAPDKDLTLQPILASSGDGIMSARYRQRLDNGDVNADFSLGKLDPVLGEDNDDAIAGETELSGRQWRGHIRAEAAYNLNETWRTGLNLNRATDASYSRAYPLFGLGSSQLVSKANVEGFRRRNYATTELLSIQSLRTNETTNSREQDVMPRLLYSGMGEADRLGGRWQFESAGRFLAVKDDDDLHRFTVEPGYGLTKTSSLGFKTDILTTVTANGYVIEHDTNRRSDEKTYEFEGIVVPKASAKLSYPFVRYGERNTQTITPILFGVTSPKVDTPDNVRLEDTIAFELDELNVLSHDRLNGGDAIDSGSRAAAALRYDYAFADKFQVDTILARMLAETENEDLNRRVGLTQSSDDWVGMISMSHRDYGSLDYRFRTKDLYLKTIRRQEVNWSVGPEYLRASGNYTFVDQDTNDALLDDEEFYSLGLSGSFEAAAPCESGAATWRYNASVTRDISADATRGVAGQISWGNECSTVALNVQRTYTEVLGRGATLDSFLLRVNLKTLGEVETSLY
jgi:LPS-assembly protein